MDQESVNYPHDAVFKAAKQISLQKRIGHAIRQARKKANLTQEQCAEKIGITQAMLSDYEVGKANLTSSQIERIFNAMDMDVEVIGKVR